MTIKEKTFSAVRWSTISALIRAVLQFAQIAILARILSPEDFGLMAIAGVILGFAGLFSDFGLNAAYVQRQNVSHEHRSSLYWLNVSVSTLLMLLVFLASPLIADFFGNNDLIPLVILSAVCLLINALGQQVLMTAEKSLDFGPVVKVEFVSALMGFVVTIGAAFMGMGVYSLVIGTIISSTATTVLAWMFISRGWRPLWRLHIADVRSYMAFGGSVLGNSIVHYFNKNIDLFIGGRLLGAEQLGLFSVPRNLALQMQFLVNPIITRVGFPLIAQLQGDLPKVRSIYLKTLNMTASTNAPLYLGIALFSPEVVDIILGPKWVGTSDILQIMAFWGLLRSTANPIGGLLLGMGKANLLMKWELALLLIVPPTLWFGSSFGTIGLAWALLIMQPVLFLPAWFFLVRPVCHLRLWDYLIALFRPIIISILSVGTASLAVSVVDFDSAARLTVGILISAPVYGALSYRFNREWVAAILELVGLNGLERGTKS